MAWHARPGHAQCCIARWPAADQLTAHIKPVYTGCAAPAARMARRTSKERNDFELKLERCATPCFLCSIYKLAPHGLGRARPGGTRLCRACHPRGWLLARQRRAEPGYARAWGLSMRACRRASGQQEPGERSWGAVNVTADPNVGQQSRCSNATPDGSLYYSPAHTTLLSSLCQVRMQSAINPHPSMPAAAPTACCLHARSVIQLCVRKRSAAHRDGAHRDGAHVCAPRVCVCACGGVGCVCHQDSLLARNASGAAQAGSTLCW